MATTCQYKAGQPPAMGPGTSTSLCTWIKLAVSASKRDAYAGVSRFQKNCLFSLGKGMAIAAVKLKGREIGPHKAVIAPLLNSRTVLTNNPPWTFVALWLRRNGKPQALFYWEQAQ